MNPYNFSVLLFSFCTFFLAIFVWFKRQDRIGFVFFLFSLFASVWGIGYAVMISSNVSYGTALYSARISQGLTMFVSYFFLELSLVLTRQEGRWEKARKVLFVFITLFQLITWHPLFIPTAEPAVSFRYYTRAGLLYHFHTLFYFTLVPLGESILIFSVSKAKTREEKNLLTGLFVSTLFGFIGGAFCFLPAYGIMAPQYGLFLIPIYPFVLAYFMTKHHIFDLEEFAQSFQREKLATIGLLAASVNHEIRNPLYAVKGLLETYLENRKEGFPGKNPDEVSEKALVQLNRALEVIGKLNRFAKPAGEESNQIASIPEAIQVILDLISNEFELDKIHIKNEVNKDIPSIQADQRQLEEIFFNLIVNACQAMKDGGELTISASCHSERSEESKHRSFANAQDDKVVITITDTGTGISQEQVRHLFEPFHTTKGEKGTGLGLYITKQLIERNRGRITVETKEDKGTTFRLEFNALQK